MPGLDACRVELQVLYSQSYEGVFINDALDGLREDMKSRAPRVYEKFSDRWEIAVVKIVRFNIGRKYIDSIVQK